MSDTIVFPVELPAMLEGFDPDPRNIERRQAKRGEVYCEPADGIGWLIRYKDAPTLGTYFVARPLALKGTAWLEAHKGDNGLAFTYGGQRYEFYTTRHSYGLWNFHQMQNAACIVGGRLSYPPDFFGSGGIEGLCDATVNILLPAIEKSNG